LYEAVKGGDYSRGRGLQNTITELCRVTRRGSVPAVKRALTLLGWKVDPPLPPLRSMSAAEDAVLGAHLASVREKAAQWMKGVIAGSNDL
jgi:dihydrodipicolinate synthase/N-acetylneuraminate lyase